MFVCPQGGGGGQWSVRWGRGGGQVQPTGGGSGPAVGGGGGQPRQDNIGSTWYTAGGMPLAFKQEDFLVRNGFVRCLPRS